MLARVADYDTGRVEILRAFHAKAEGVECDRSDYWAQINKETGEATLKPGWYEIALYNKDDGQQSSFIDDTVTHWADIDQAAEIDLLEPAKPKFFYDVSGIRHSAIVRAESPEAAIAIAVQPGRIGDWEGPTANLIGSEMPDYYGSGM